jgi:hypothetical protein
MSHYFCMQCAEERFGPAVVEESRRSAAAAPRLREEQIIYLRALFASVRSTPPKARERAEKRCEHDA